MSAATDKGKASIFVCQRLNILLTNIAANATKKNVKEVVRVLMPFIQGATQGREQDADEERVSWLTERC